MQNDRLKKDICQYIIAKSDFSAARKAAELLKSYIDESCITSENCYTDDLYFALYSTIVTSYAKPFSKNHPLGKIKGLKNYFKRHKQLILHDSLIILRNKTTAHSDYSYRYVTFYPRGSYDKESHFLGVKNNVLTPDKILEIGELTEIMIQALDELYLPQIEDLYESLGKPKKPLKLKFD